MAYERTIWESRTGSNLNRFEKERETSSSIILHNAPSSLEKPGTKFSTANMNKIEQGIYDAHEMIAAEELQRIAADDLLRQAVDAEAQSRQETDRLLQLAIDTESDARQFAVSALQTAVDLIKGLIPNQASFENLLADRNFVNSTLANSAAWFLTPDSLGAEQWSSLEALRTGPWYSGGMPKQPMQNDYAIFINQNPELGPINSVWRASFSGELWSPQYKVNDTPFTAAQLAAINSDITAALVDTLKYPDTEPVQNSGSLITSGGVFAWFGAAVNTLKTAAKNAVGAINELFDSTVKLTSAQTISGVKTFSDIPLLPSTDPTNNNHAVRLNYVNQKINALSPVNVTFNIPSAYVNQNIYMQKHLLRIDPDVATSRRKGIMIRLWGTYEYGDGSLVRAFAGSFFLRWGYVNGAVQNISIGAFSTNTSGGTANVRLYADRAYLPQGDIRFTLRIVVRNQASSSQTSARFDINIDAEDTALGLASCAEEYLTADPATRALVVSTAV